MVGDVFGHEYDMLVSSPHNVRSCKVVDQGLHCFLPD